MRDWSSLGQLAKPRSRRKGRSCRSLEIGQVSIAIQKEQNGYVLNVWLQAMSNAAVSLVENGEGLYTYPNQDYTVPDFSPVPPLSAVEDVALRAML